MSPTEESLGKAAVRVKEKIGRRGRGLYSAQMGTFEVDVELGGIDGRRFEPVRALVDTGSSYMRVPGNLLRSLGIEPTERQRFEMADGREAEYDIGQAQVRLDGRTRYNIVVFGEDDSAPLLGAVTLEAFRLGVDPVGQHLVPVVGLMM